MYYWKAMDEEKNYSKKLQNSLALNGLEEKDLPIILKRLQQLALDKKGIAYRYADPNEQKGT